MTSKLYYASENTRLRKYYQDINQAQRNIERDMILNKKLIDERAYDEFIKTRTTSTTTQLPSKEKPIVSTDISSPVVFKKTTYQDDLAVVRQSLLRTLPSPTFVSPPQPLTPTYKVQQEKISYTPGLLDELRQKLNKPEHGLKRTSSPTSTTQGKQGSPKKDESGLVFRDLQATAGRMRDYIKSKYPKDKELTKISLISGTDRLKRFLDEAKDKYPNDIQLQEIIMPNPQPSYNMQTASGLLPRKHKSSLQYKRLLKAY